MASELGAAHDPWAVVPPAGSGRSSLPRVAGLVGLAIGSGLWWWRGHVWWVPVVALAAGTGLALAAVRGAPWARGVEGAVGRAVAAVVSVIGAALVTVVAALLLWGPGAVRRTTRRVGGSRHGWRRAEADVDRARRDAVYPFVSTAPARARRRLAVGAVVTVAVIAAAVAVRTRAPDGAPGVDQERIELVAGMAAAQGQPQVRQMVEDQVLVPLPPSTIGGYRLGDHYDTPTTDVVDGVRRTLAPAPCPGCPRATVWFTGGSAGFGQGQRDEHTIPSQLVREADADGVRLDVVNMAVLGYTLWQEYQGVLARVADGERPDLVVFHDGFNDVLFTLADDLDGLAAPERPVVYGDHVARIMDRRDEINDMMDGAGGPEAFGVAAGRRLRDLREVVRAGLEAEGVEVLFDFQPDALSDPYQSEVARPSNPGMEPEFASVLDAVIVSALDVLGPGDRRARERLDGRGVPYFFDVVHINEAGAAVAAADLYGRVAAALGLEGGP